MRHSAAATTKMGATCPWTCGTVQSLLWNALMNEGTKTATEEIVVTVNTMMADQR